MNIDLKLVAEVIGILLTIGGVLYGIFKWVTAMNNQKAELERVKGENSIICKALFACLDGLEQLGANDVVPKAKRELNDYINELAHK